MTARPPFPFYGDDPVWRPISQSGEPMPRIGTGGKAELLGAVLAFESWHSRLFRRLFIEREQRFIRWGAPGWKARPGADFVEVQRAFFPQRGKGHRID